MIDRAQTVADMDHICRTIGSVRLAANRLGIQPGHILTILTTNYPIPNRLARRIRTCAVLCGAPRSDTYLQFDGIPGRRYA